MARRSALLLLPAVALIAAVPLAQAITPKVKKRGNAIWEYEDDRIQAVVAYEYSNRHHGGAWIFVDAAIRTTDNLVFERGDFTLLTPNEKTVTLGEQSRFLDDAKQITKVRQNATVWQRDLNSYFIDKTTNATYRLFALPGDGVTTDSIVTDAHGAASLTLYFESASRSWPEGTYQLKIDNGKARAVIPIELQ
jgi:hypothetical protein